MNERFERVIELHNRIHRFSGSYHNHIPSFPINSFHQSYHLSIDDLTIGAWSNQPCISQINGANKCQKMTKNMI